MAPLTKASVALKGLLTSLADLVEAEWKPGNLPTEIKYRDSLLAFLRKSVPDDARLEREYRHGGTTADIYLSWQGVVFPDQVFIEIKRDLRQKPSLDRLVGQLESLDPANRKVLLVLVGDTDEALLGRITEKYADHLRSTGNMEIAIVRPKRPRSSRSG